MKRQKSVLVIDDDVEVSNLIEETLQKEFPVVTVSTASDGLRLLKDQPFSLVILDYLLPDKDGVETLRLIRNDHRIPIIMITAFGNKDVVLQSWQYRADFYFDKPFSFKDLREKVRELLSDETPFRILGIDPDSLSADAKSAVEYIWKNILDTTPGRLSRNSIASATSVSPKYLSSLFSRECGKSISECINLFRFEKAKEMLGDKGRHIKEVARDIGFKHPGSFSRSFRKITGIPPSSQKK